jgi:hypothetical protein
MSYYLVTAKPIPEKLNDLRKWLDSGEISAMQPFGRSLYRGLHMARWQSEGIAIWEEEDYCVPPLAQERAAVLDEYFTDLNVEIVERDKGWERIGSLPRLWADKI